MTPTIRMAMGQEIQEIREVKPLEMGDRDDRRRKKMQATIP